MKLGEAWPLLLAGMFAAQAAAGCFAQMAVAQMPSRPGSVGADQSETASEEAVEADGDDRIVPLEPLPLSAPESENRKPKSVDIKPGDPLVVPLEPLATPRAAVVEPLRDPASEAPREVDLRAAEVAIRDWAAAWSDQRVADYLLFYSRRFRPPNGWTRQQWETQRRARLTLPSFVEVSLDSVSVQVTDAGRVRGEFSQVYRSDRYSDKVVKSLELAREDGLWKIVAEDVISVTARN